MNKLSSKREVSFLAALCAAAYFVSYLSRNNLSAVLVEVVASGFAPKTTAALDASPAPRYFGLAFD